MPKVSVIIPTFNRAESVQRAVESVQGQTFRDLELIVVDDGSTDDTNRFFSRKQPNIKYLRQENRGVAAARNAGIRAADSPYIAFLDSDDHWLPGKLEWQMYFHETTGQKISQTEEIWIRHGKRANPKDKHRKPSGWMFEPSLKLCLISPSAVLLDREVFDACGFFDESFEICEDYELWLRVTARYPVGLLSEPLVVKYGGHPDQLSRKHWGMDRWRIRAMEKILAGGGLTDVQKKACIRELRSKCSVYAAGCRKRDKPAEADQYARLAARYDHETIPA